MAVSTHVIPDEIPVSVPLAQRPLVRVTLALLCTAAAIAAVKIAYDEGPLLMPFESTDDAYVGGNVTFVAPQVSGYVTQVLTEDDRTVAPGQVLVRIDPTDYVSAVAGARAAIASGEAQIARVDAEMDLQQAQIRVADAGTEAAQAALVKAAADYGRSDALVNNGTVSRQVGDDALAEKVRARAALTESRAMAKAARKQVAVLDAEQQSALAAIQEARARLARAEADLRRTAIVAPREGRVAARNVRVGEYVSPGTRLLAITPTKDLWVDANMRETQLDRIRKGDRVQFTVDAIRDRRFCGTVEGIQGASGSDLSVLPADNATGNFTKIVRRFPIRIRLDADQPGIDRLSAGMSVLPMIAVDDGSRGHLLGGLLSRLIYGRFDCYRPS